MIPRSPLPITCARLRIERNDMSVDKQEQKEVTVISFLSKDISELLREVANWTDENKNSKSFFIDIVYIDEMNCWECDIVITMQKSN